MATVYLADDLPHGRQVAIKVFHPELSADSGSAHGRLFYVTPYVEGETLRRLLHRTHQLPVADAVRIASDAADALEYAHGHGIVHRDIKPENILLGSAPDRLPRAIRLTGGLPHHRHPPRRPASCDDRVCRCSGSSVPSPWNRGLAG
jgi:serine/threonine protein kinase